MVIRKTRKSLGGKLQKGDKVYKNILYSAQCVECISRTGTEMSIWEYFAMVFRKR